MAKSKKKRDVVFRRIRGRIVPIRVKNADKYKRKSRKGAGLLAAGAATIIGSEITSARLAVKPLKTHGDKIVAARDILRAQQANAALLGKANESALKRIANLTFGKQGFKTAMKKGLSKATKVRSAGGFLGAALIGVGANEISEGLSRKDTGISGEVISNIAGAGAGLLGARFFRKALVKGTFKSPFKLKDKAFRFRKETGQQMEFDL